MKRTNHLDLVFIIFNKKWISQILWRLRLEPQRQKDFKQNIEGINERTLSLHLKFLLEKGVISKKDFNVYPRHTEYSLTELGKELVRILEFAEEVSRNIGTMV